MTAKHVDDVPTTRMTRRQSREKEEREKARELLQTSSSSDVSSQVGNESKKTEGISQSKSSSSTSTLPVESKPVQKKVTVKSKAAVNTDTSTEKDKGGVDTVGSKSTAKPASSSSKDVVKEKEKVTSGKATVKTSTKPSKSTSRPSTGSSTEISAVVVPAVKKPPSRRKTKKTDPAQCLEIISPMYDLFYQHEEENLVKPYMGSQKDINNRMRGILVDWLVEVHYKFRLHATTLWLTVNLLDRYLERKPLLRNRLQLLGVTCLLIACKFEEIYPPEVRDCVFVTDNAYSRDEVLSMEQSVLSVLDYQLCVPTGYHFLTRYLNLIHANEKMRHLSFYYAERNLQESITVATKPSQLVSAALYCALVYDMQDIYQYESEDGLDYPHAVWPDILIEETGFEENDLLPIARLLMKHVSEEPVTTSHRHLIAAKKKYSHDKFFNVAEFELPCL